MVDVLFLLLIAHSCIFLPENGAFFVNFIITSAFIGTALELIRFPELFYYGINMLWTRSEAEKITKRSVSVVIPPYGFIRICMRNKKENTLINYLTTVHKISWTWVSKEYGLTKLKHSSSRV